MLISRGLSWPVVFPLAQNVLRPHKALNFAVQRDVAAHFDLFLRPWLQLGLPVRIGPLIPPRTHGLGLFVGPRIQVDALHTGDMRSKRPVDPAASDANEHAKVPRRPSWVPGRFAICTMLVAWVLQQLHQAGPVFRCGSL